MYYIKQKLGMKKFVVKNTDDNTEEVLSWDEVEIAVCQLGIKIEGVYTRSWHGGSAGPLVVYKVDVYVPPSERTGKEAKLKMLNGVDIKTNNGYIASVSWQKPRDGKMRVVRLSDYGRTLGVAALTSHILGVWSKLEPSYLTVILDDKLEVMPKTFKKIGDLYSRKNLDIVIDLREVTKPSIINAFYREFTDTCGPPDHWRYIKDKQDRLDLWAGICLINNGLPYKSEGMYRPSEFISDIPFTKPRLLAMFSKEFASLATKYVFTSSEFWATSDPVLNYLDWIRHDGKFYLMSDDFATIWRVYNTPQEYNKSAKDVMNLSWLLQSCCDRSMPKAVVRLERYINIFGASADVAKYFIGFYRRANASILEWAQSMGI